LLFGSLVVDATEAVSVMVVPDVTVVLTLTTNVKVAVAFLAKVVPSVHVYGDAVVQVQPAGPVRETNVVLAGNVSVTTGAAAVAGPALDTQP
jgi:hypothetical protein